MTTQQHAVAARYANNFVRLIRGKRCVCGVSEFVQRKRQLDLCEPAVAALKIHATGGPHPERPIRSEVKSVDNAIRNSRVGAVALELAAVIAVKTILGANPEISRSVLLDAGDIRVAEPL